MSTKPWHNKWAIWPFLFNSWTCIPVMPRYILPWAELLVSWLNQACIHSTTHHHRLKVKMLLLDGWNAHVDCDISTKYYTLIFILTVLRMFQWCPCVWLIPSPPNLGSPLPTKDQAELHEEGGGDGGETGWGRGNINVQGERRQYEEGNSNERNTCKVNNHAITYSKCHGMGNAKLRNIPCPQWLEVICQTDLPTSVTEWGRCGHSELRWISSNFTHTWTFWPSYHQVQVWLFPEQSLGMWQASNAKEHDVHVLF